MQNSGIYRLIFKRCIDVVAALTVMVLLSPLYLGVMFWLAVVNKGHVFFVQERPGKNAKSFFIFKFKTMTDEKDASGKLLPDNQRLTSAGAFVRKWSLDELPQLLNVLKGDMSLIGPRPLLPKYLPLYSAVQARRHEMRPGITGWAQVNGRNSISWTQKFEMDVYYIDHCSFGLDVRIVLLTLKKVFKREGVNQTESRPMEPFNGYN